MAKRNQRQGGNEQSAGGDQSAETAQQTQPESGPPRPPREFPDPPAPANPDTASQEPEADLASESGDLRVQLTRNVAGQQYGNTMTRKEADALGIDEAHLRPLPGHNDRMVRSGELAQQ